MPKLYINCHTYSYPYPVFTGYTSEEMEKKNVNGSTQLFLSPCPACGVTHVYRFKEMYFFNLDVENQPKKVKKTSLLEHYYWSVRDYIVYLFKRNK